VTDRLEQFREEVARLRVRGGSPEPERRLVWLGVALLAAGIGVGLFVFVGERRGDIAVADDYLALAPLAVALAVTGAVVWFRHSLTHYLRYWLTRLVYEDRAQTDRIVAALERIERRLPGGLGAEEGGPLAAAVDDEVGPADPGGQR
jgi:hypothetical protein